MTTARRGRVTSSTPATTRRTAPLLRTGSCTARSRSATSATPSACSASPSTACSAPRPAPRSAPSRRRTDYRRRHRRAGHLGGAPGAEHAAERASDHEAEQRADRGARGVGVPGGGHAELHRSGAPTSALQQELGVTADGTFGAGDPRGGGRLPGRRTASSPTASSDRRRAPRSVSSRADAASPAHGRPATPPPHDRRRRRRDDHRRRPIRPRDGGDIDHDGTTATTDGDDQHAPAARPLRSQTALDEMVAAGDQIATLPYIWGGGHGSWISPGYDCSGSVSYVLHAAGLLSVPEDSSGLESYGAPVPASTSRSTPTRARLDDDRGPALRHRRAPGDRLALVGRRRRVRRLRRTPPRRLLIRAGRAARRRPARVGRWESVLTLARTVGVPRPSCGAGRWAAASESEGRGRPHEPPAREGRPSGAALH